MEDQSLKMDEGCILMGLFALKEKAVGELLSVSIRFYCTFWVDEL